MSPRKERPLRRSVSALWYRTLWRVFPSRILHRIRTAVWFAADDAERCFDRVDEALDLIQRFDPGAMDSIRRHFAGILVFGEERFRAAYWLDDARLCVVTSRHLESSDVPAEGVALTLVHENMHARLRAAGARYEDGRRAHIEVLCAMAELAFARRIPYHSSLAEQTERRIEAWATAGEAAWSNDTQRAQRFKQLREMGTPQWLVAALDRLARILRGRAA